MLHVVTVQKVPADVAAVVNSGGARIDRPRRIKACKVSLLQYISVAHAGGVEIVPHDVSVIVETYGASPGRAREVDGSEAEGWACRRSGRRTRRVRGGLREGHGN